MCSEILKFSFRKQIIAAIVLTCILKLVHLQQCGSKLTFNKKHIGQRLVGFNILTLTEDSIGKCVNKCFQLSHCLSTNFDKVSKQCDLNNITADQMPTAIVKSDMSILSDLSAWPKSMMASCGDNPCNGRDICMPAGNTFLCHNSDCPKAPFVGKATSTGSLEIGGEMVYKCSQPLHRIVGEDKIHCGWMNTWSSNKEIKCIADCGYPSITCQTGASWSAEPTCELKHQCYDTKNHKMYVGYYAKTQSGKTCQRWDSQTPHEHNRNETARFPDATLADAANYCRDPANEEGFLWCYTTDPDSRWEGCGMIRCEC